MTVVLQNKQLNDGNSIVADDVPRGLCGSGWLDEQLSDGNSIVDADVLRELCGCGWVDKKLSDGNSIVDADVVRGGGCVSVGGLVYVCAREVFVSVVDG